MNCKCDRKMRFRARSAALLWMPAGLLLIALTAPSALTFPAKEPGSPENPGGPGAARTSIFRSGVLETKEGLTLRLVADLGSVNIMPIEAGSSPVVRYTVHVETDARGAAAAQLLKNYSLKAGTSSTGVEIAGQLFPPDAHSTNAQFWVQFQIAMPRNYNLEVNT